MRMKPDMPAGVQLSRQSRNRGLAGLTTDTARRASRQISDAANSHGNAENPKKQAANRKTNNRFSSLQPHQTS